MAPTIVDLTGPDPIESVKATDPPKAEELDPNLALDHAIQNVKDDILRRVVKALCRREPIAAEFLKGELLVSEANVKIWDDETTDNEEEEDDEDEESEGEHQSDPYEEEEQPEEETRKYLKKDIIEPKPSRKDIAQMAGKKRLLTRFVVCAQCKEDFDVTQNGSLDCNWHPGKKKLFLFCLYKTLRPVSGLSRLFTPMVS